MVCYWREFDLKKSVTEMTYKDVLKSYLGLLKKDLKKREI